METLHDKVSRQIFKGKSLEPVKIWVRHFLDLSLDKMLNKRVIPYFTSAKSDKHLTLLLSSSPDFLVCEIAQRMGFDEWSATEYLQTPCQIFNGIGELMEGRAKAKITRRLMKEKNIQKNNVFAYTDSYLDLPLLESVGNPIVVNPDPKLKRISLKRNWKQIYTKF